MSERDCPLCGSSNTHPFAPTPFGMVCGDCGEDFDLPDPEEEPAPVYRELDKADFKLPDASEYTRYSYLLR